MLDRLKRMMPYVITGIILITLLIVQFVVIDKKEFNRDEFLIGAAINAAIIVIVAVTWQATGKDKALNEEGSVYQANLKDYSAKIDSVNDGKIGSLAEFCKLKTEEMRTNKKKAFLSRRCIDYAKFETEYRSLPGKKLKALGLTKSQRRGVFFAKVLPFRVRKLEPVELMTGCKVRDEYDIHYNEAADRSLRVALKVIRSIITGSVFAMISVNLGKNLGDLTAWATFGLMTIVVASSAWSGYNDGYNLIAETKKDAIKRRVWFLNSFLEWHSKQCAKPPDAQEPTKTE